jgi:transketolase
MCHGNGLTYWHAEHIATLQLYNNGQTFAPTPSHENSVALPLAVPGPSETVVYIVGKQTIHHRSTISTVVQTCRHNQYSLRDCKNYDCLR